MRLLPRVLALAALAIAAAVTPSLALTAQHRLDHKVVPTSETLRLDVDPAKSDYSGAARIAIKVTAAADSFQLHAHDMTIRKLTVQAGVSMKATDIPRQASIPATWRTDDH